MLVTGAYEGNTFVRCRHAVMNVSDMTWVHILLAGRLKTRSWRGMGLQRERKQV